MGYMRKDPLAYRDNVPRRPASRKASPAFNGNDDTANVRRMYFDEEKPITRIMRQTGLSLRFIEGAIREW